MKKMAALFFMLFLMSCSSSSSGGSAGTPANSSGVGVFLDTQTVTDKLFVAFEKVKEEAKSCLGFDRGEFVDLSILFNERSTIACDSNGCKGAFISPNIVHLSVLDPTIWRHEFMHYLLLVNTGNAFKDHQHALFKGECPGTSAGVPPGTSVSAGFSGVFLDREVSFKLFEAFEEAKVCSGLQKGDFLALSILFREGSDIACDTSGCTGAFLEDVGNLVYLSTLEPTAWRHEFIHYLLFVNNNNAFQDHDHPLFINQDCISGI